MTASTVYLLANPASGTADEGDMAAVTRSVTSKGHLVVDLTGTDREGSARNVAEAVAGG